MPERPEQNFFEDPALDRAMGVIMALAAELYVVKDRLRCLEGQLERASLIERTALDQYEPSPEEQARNMAERDAFSQALLSQLRGTQVSRGVA